MNNMAYDKSIFDKTEIPERVTKLADDFMVYLRKTVPNIAEIKYTCGISLTRFEVIFPQGYNISRFTGSNARRSYLSKFNSFFCTNHSNLYQDKNMLIIEIPNEDRGILHFDRAVKALSELPKEEGKIQFYIGEKVDGTPLIGDIAEYPNILVAGAAGSGKSVNMQTVLLSMLGRYDENELNLYLFDTKRVEFSMYKGRQIRQIKGHVTDPDIVYSKLNSLQKEMNRRYDFLAENRYQKLSDYNAEHPSCKVPYIVIMFDEYADLIASCSCKEVNEIVKNLANKARAAGIYVFLCTQRPDAKTVDSRVREQLSGRICFRVNTSLTSNMVIKTSGAENLRNKGDGYFLNGDIPVRFQGALLTKDEIERAIQSLEQ